MVQVTWFLHIITHEGTILRWKSKTGIAILNILRMSAMIIFIDNPGPSHKIPLFKCQFYSDTNTCKKVRMNIYWVHTKTKCSLYSFITFRYRKDFLLCGYQDSLDVMLQEHTWDKNISNIFQEKFYTASMDSQTNQTTGSIEFSWFILFLFMSTLQNLRVSGVL